MSNKKKPNNVIPLPLTEQDEADLAQLHSEDEIRLPDAPFHPILEVWREILKPAFTLENDVITPQWSMRMVASYPGVDFKDMGELQARYFGILQAMAHILNDEIASDDECLNATTAEEDLEHNVGHYKAVLVDWQKAFLTRELGWRFTDPFAGAEIAALSEAHKAVFGDMGIVSYLDNIRFNTVYTEDDQNFLASELEAVREGAS